VSITNIPNIIKESIHIVFDESNDGRLSSTSFQELELSRYDDEEEDNARSKANKQHEEPPKETNNENNMPPTSEEPNIVNEQEASPNASNEEILSEPRQGYKFKSYHP